MLATVCPTNSLSSLRDPELAYTKSLRPTFSSSGICWARRRRNSLSVSLAATRLRRTSSRRVMSMMWSNRCSNPVSNSSGTSTTMRAGRGRAFCWRSTHSATASRTNGCSRSSSQRSSASSEKTMPASAGRLMPPAPSTTASPKRSRMRSTTSAVEYRPWTMSSLEMVAAPSSCRYASAVDLPEPMPPVRPRTGMRVWMCSWLPS